MFKSEENQNNINRLVRFLSRKNEPGYIFAYVEGGQTNLNISNTLQEKIPNVGKLFLEADSDQTILVQMEQFIEKTKCEALIIANLDQIIGDEKLGKKLLTEINFAREAFYRIEIPILFWISESTFSELSNEAPDLYSQRRLSTVIFEKESYKIIAQPRPFSVNDSEVLYDTKKTETTRLKLLEEQYKKALHTKIHKKALINDFVLPYMDELVSNNYKEKVQKLFKLYEADFDVKNELWSIMLGSIFADLRDFDKAIYYYSSAIESDKEQAPSHYIGNLHLQRGYAYVETGKINQAIEDLQLAKTHFHNLNNQSPKNYSYINNLRLVNEKLGFCYIHIDKLEEAEIYLQELLEINLSLINKNYNIEHTESELAIAYEHLGELYVNLGKFQDALQYFLKSIEIGEKLYNQQSDNVTRKSNLSISYYQIGRLQSELGNSNASMNYYLKSERLQRELVEIEPNSINKSGLVNILMPLATMYHYINNKEKSIEYLEESLNISREIYNESPNDLKSKNTYGTVLANMAQFYKVNGELKKANMLNKKTCVIFEELHEQYPDYKIFEANLDDVRKIRNELEKLKTS